jgi:hypothetical protein
MRLTAGIACMLLAFALLAACGGDSADRPSADDLAAAICAATPQAPVTVQASDITEASGIAASRQNKDVLWLHNDSGDTARVFAIDRTGALLGTYTLAAADAIDWEDMAIGPGPEKDVDYLYLADIGDNAAQRSEIDVYRVPEPRVTKGDTPTMNALSGVEKLALRYPDHPHDAETFMVDWMNGDLLIITKELSNNVSGVFRALPWYVDTISEIVRLMPNSSGAGMLEQIATIDFRSLSLAATPGPDAPALVRALPLLPTGGDMSRDGSLIAIRSYGAVWVWARPPDATMADVFATQPCEAPSIAEQQGEAIALDPDGRGYVSTSEGANPPLHHFSTQLRSYVGA